MQMRIGYSNRNDFNIRSCPDFDTYNAEKEAKSAKHKEIIEMKKNNKKKKTLGGTRRRRCIHRNKRRSIRRPMHIRQNV
jgi:hypothetical protein